MKHTCWCHGCGEIHTETKNGSIIGGCCDYGRNHSQTCALVKEFNNYNLTDEENMEIKGLLAYFNSFKTLKEYLGNDKDISQIDQTGFYHANRSLSNQEKQVFKQLREREREREREQKCLSCQKTVEENGQFCDDKCVTKWIKDKFEPFINYVIRGSGSGDKGTQCKTCKQKVSDIHCEGNWRIDIKRDLSNLINHSKCCIKEPRKPEKNPNSSNCCEKCGASCLVKGKGANTIQRTKFVKHSTDFTREETCWFGLNCGCIEKFKRENQQTCPQCHKTEFPAMKNGWLLDYEVKKAFCSPLCHCTYRELQWEETQKLTKVELAPPELEVTNNNQSDFDWEKEGLKQEVLRLRELTREMEGSLSDPNLSPQQRQQVNYLQTIQRNTLQRAEQNYQNKYGNLDEKPTNYLPYILGGVGIFAIVALIIALMMSNNKRRK